MFRVGLRVGCWFRVGFVGCWVRLGSRGERGGSLELELQGHGLESIPSIAGIFLMMPMMRGGGGPCWVGGLCLFVGPPRCRCSLLPRGSSGRFSLDQDMAVAQKKQEVPKWNPGKWNHGPQPAVCPSCLILSHHMSPTKRVPPLRGFWRHDSTRGRLGGVPKLDGLPAHPVGPHHQVPLSR